ncbi:hypothetical protein KJ068_06795 [bacterium]|nr:hypothetical protein [bacterium]
MPKPSNISMPTSDLSKFDDAVLEEAIALLKAYRFQRRQKRFLKSGVRLYFSNASGMVFLADERLNVAVLDDGELTQGRICRRCTVQRSESQGAGR